jgi:hypothetical protein
LLVAHGRRFDGGEVCFQHGAPRSKQRVCCLTRTPTNSIEVGPVQMKFADVMNVGGRLQQQYDLDPKA